MTTEYCIAFQGGSGLTFGKFEKVESSRQIIRFNQRFIRPLARSEEADQVEN